jgi:phage protein D/phage baseplate assembly protein gpV
MTAPEKTLTGEWEIKVNGSPLPPPVMQAVLEITVDTDMNLPDSASIQLDDAAQAAQSDPSFALFMVGASVEISAQGPANSSPKKIFQGEITGIEVDFTVQRKVTIVRASDKSAELHRGRKTKTYLKIKDSDLAQQLASAAGLTADVDTTTQMYEYVAQANQTDWEFLRSRADRIGYDLFAKDGKLTFKKPAGPSGGTPFTCQLGDNMLEFHARLSSVQQVSKVTVNGWDEKTKQKVTASSSPSGSKYESVGMTLGDPGVKTVVGPTSEYLDVVSGPITQGAAQDLADTIAEDLASSFAEAEAYLVGDNSITAGELIETKGVGTKFEGKWRITKARHTRHDGGYFCELTCSGRMDRTLAGLTRQLPPRTADVGSAPVIGIVTNIKDQQTGFTNRVKVKFPWLNDSEESAWARVMHPGAGKERGFQWMPEVGDEVLVVFEQGDFQRPVVIGGLYNGKDLPAESDYAPQNSTTDKRTLTSRSGAFLQFDDSSGKEFVHLSLDKDKKYILSMDKAGQKIIITSDGQIEIHGKMDIKIMSDNGKISLEASKGDIELKAMNVKMEAQAQAQLKGVQLNLEASAAAALKGATVSLG